MKKIYKAKEGATFGKDKAELYGKALEDIEKKHNGILTPSVVLNEARNKSNPLHNYFNWNNNDAGEKYRLVQARLLINHIEIVIVHEGTEKETRAYVNVSNVTEEGDKNQIYVTVERALTNKEYRRQTLANAIREAEYWKNKYKEFKELSSIFQAIKKTKIKFRI